MGILENAEWENQLKWWIFQQAMFDCHRLYPIKSNSIHLNPMKSQFLAG
jgi:hypothetical protein